MEAGYATMRVVKQQKAPTTESLRIYNSIRAEMNMGTISCGSVFMAVIWYAC